MFQIEHKAYTTSTTLRATTAAVAASIHVAVKKNAEEQQT